jgi:hypothetical protein
MWVNAFVNVVVWAVTVQVRLKNLMVALFPLEREIWDDAQQAWKVIPAPWQTRARDFVRQHVRPILLGAMVLFLLSVLLAVAAQSAKATEVTALPMQRITSPTNGVQIEQLQAGTGLALQPPTTASPSLNFPNGTAPSAPVSGDCWSQTVSTVVALECFLNSTASPLLQVNGITAGTGITLTDPTAVQVNIACTIATGGAAGCVIPDGVTTAMSVSALVVTGQANGQYNCAGTIIAGDFVALTPSGGTLKMVDASAANLTLPAVGIAQGGCTASAGVNTIFTLPLFSVATSTTLTVGTYYYLSASSPGKATATPPSTAGQLLQPLGFAVSTSFLQIAIGQGIGL